MERRQLRLEYNDKLIAAVHCRPMLWDCNDASYNDFRRKLLVRAEVEQEIGPDPDCK